MVVQKVNIFLEDSPQDFIDRHYIGMFGGCLKEIRNIDNIHSFNNVVQPSQRKSRDIAKNTLVGVIGYYILV